MLFREEENDIDQKLVCIQRKEEHQEGIYNGKIKIIIFKGVWMAQSVKRLTLAQVVISWLTGSSPTLGSVLTAQSLEPASDSVSSSLTLPLPCSQTVSLSLSKINKH